MGYAFFDVNSNYSWGIPVNIVEVEVAPDANFRFGKVSDGGQGQDQNGVPLKLVASSGPGAQWTADVTLVGAGPNAAWGVKYITVGFMQTVQPLSDSAGYVNASTGFTAQASFVGQGDNVYWDTKDAPGNAYDAPSVALYDRSSGAVDAAPRPNTQVEISSADSPSSGPWLAVNGVPLDSSMHLGWNITTYVVAQTSDATENSAAGANLIYTARAGFEWTFDASGYINNNNYGWVSAPKIVGDTPGVFPTYPSEGSLWYSISDGLQPVDPLASATNPQPQLRFNWVLRHATWSRSN